MYHADKFIFKKNCAVHNFDSPRSQQKYMLDIQFSFKGISSTVTDLPMNNLNNYCTLEIDGPLSLNIVFSEYEENTK